MHTLNFEYAELKAIAMVDATVAPGQTLLWDWNFAPAQEPADVDFIINFNSDDPVGNFGFNFNSEWQFTAEAGIDASHPVTIAADNGNYEPGEILHTLTAVGDVFTLTLEDPNDHLFWIYQSPEQTAVVYVQQKYQYANSGVLPDILACGHTLNMTYFEWDTPRPGVLTASAKLYDADGQLLIISNPITLTVSDPVEVAT